MGRGERGGGGGEGRRRRKVEEEDITKPQNKVKTLMEDEEADGEVGGRGYFTHSTFATISGAYCIPMLVICYRGISSGDQRDSWSSPLFRHPGAGLDWSLSQKLFIF